MNGAYAGNGPCRDPGQTQGHITTQNSPRVWVALAAAGWVPGAHGPVAGRMEQPGGAGLTRDRRVSENRSQCRRDQTPNHKPLLSSHNGLCGDHMNVAAGNFCLPLFSSPGHGTSCLCETRTVAAGSSQRACPERWPPPDLPRGQQSWMSVSILTLQAWGCARGISPRTWDPPGSHCLAVLWRLCSGAHLGQLEDCGHAGGSASAPPSWSSALSPLLGLGVRGREVPAHESSAIAGERGPDNLGISHPSLPRKGGSERERPGGARGWERKPAA